VEVLPDHFMKSAERLGPVISYGFGERLVIILNGKEAISDAFLKKSEAFADRAEFWAERNLFNPNLRGIIFARYNDTFKRYHKLCLTILKEFGFGVNSVSETRILREVEALTEKILKFNGRPFDPKPLSTDATFNVVSSILFGETFVSTDTCRTISQRSTEFASNTDFALNFASFLRFLPSIRKKCYALVKCHEDIINSIEKGINFSKSGDCESTFVKRFIEIQGPDYDQQDLLFILRDLCFASADTVSTTVTWAIAELANHPEVQTRFQREIDDVVPKERFPSLDDKQRLPYTEAVILEIMRRHTAIPLYVPHAALKDTEVLGYHVPKGSMVNIN
jgi:cytochrome P450